MRPVDQTIVGEQGNCFSACIASLLEMKLEDVPYFISYGREWAMVLFKFLGEHYYDFHGTFYLNGRTTEEAWPQLLERSSGVDGYFILGGTSPRGIAAGHAVVYKDGVMVHDPHQSRAGVIIPEDVYMIERMTDDERRLYEEYRQRDLA